MRRAPRIAGAIVAAGLLVASPARSAGDPSSGERAFRACAPCHSLQPDRNMTGPSLADLWGRTAGSLPSFRRYSSALKASGVTWDDKTLDAWLKDPKRNIPGNHMIFPGLPDDQARADLIAFLKRATAPGQAPTRTAATAPVPNLRHLAPDHRVTAIGHCRDTYRLTTADGQTKDFWERNLRFKTDSSDEGPTPGSPAIEGAGMVGDRASVIFASPERSAARSSRHVDGIFAAADHGTRSRRPSGRGRRCEAATYRSRLVGAWRLTR